MGHVHTRELRIGVIGLGRAFTLMLPTFTADPRVRLVAAFDPRSEATARFAAEFGASIHASAEALCADPAVDVVYVASPVEHHAAHAIAAAARGKHVLVEKPMAVIARGMPVDGRRGGARARAPRRRPQPQLRSSHSAHARAHRERRVRRGRG